MIISYHKQKIHAYVLRLLRKREGALLDFASYGGEFIIKLFNSGTDLKVTASDRDLSNYEGPAKAIKFDLNGDFSKKIKGKYDYITAIEVIEHLENPYSLFRNTHDILKEKGLFILSTPHIASFWSKLLFLFFGHFWMLDYKRCRPEKHGDDHIIAIIPSGLKYMAELGGFRLKKETYLNHYLPLPYIRIPSPIKIPAFAENVVMVFEKT